jgi:hypothetical protein
MKFIKCFKTLFIGGRDGFSRGWIGFWLVFGLAVYHWYAGKDIPMTQFWVLMGFLGYNLGGKAVKVVKGGPEPPTPPSQ